MIGYFHPSQRSHATQTYFSRGALRTPQEVSARIDPLRRAFKRLGIAVRQPEDAGAAAIEAVHSPNYVEFLRTANQEWIAHSDWGDEAIPKIFVRAAAEPRGILAKTPQYQAVGSCPIAAADPVVSGADDAYALCRPPGHHACPEAAGGFCYLTNSAITAQFLRGKGSRVAALDTDMHHGQGTPEIFYERDDVLFVSTVI